MSNTNSQIRALTEQFANSLSAIVEAAAADRLRAALGSAFAGPKRRGRPPGTGRKLAPASPAVAARRRLQGQYLGLIRHLSARDRARTKAVAKKSGVAAAVKFGARFAK